MFYALIAMRASEGVVFPRVPLNLCLVLDHSSSMLRGNKVDRLKDTVRGIVAQLDEDDFLSIVTFGDRAEILLPAQPLRDKALVRGAIDAMRCRGGTEISRGLAAGLSELARNASRALSHLILLTDGQTYGDEMLCLEHAEAAAAARVGITAYGLGDDWNSALLDGIAGPTGGHADYIESPEEMAHAFSARVLALQSTTLRRVTLSTRPAAGCSVQRATLVGPILRALDLAAEGGALVSTLGDMSGHADYRVLLELVLGPCQPGTMAVADLTLCYDVPGLQREAETLHVPLAVTVTPDHDPAAPVDPRVTEALRYVTVHRLQQQAWTEINSGDRLKGTGLLKRAAEHLEVAGHDELARVAVEEAARVEGGAAASDQNVKRIIYGTRKLSPVDRA
jgi:Ca-activated chloride channel family protein